MSTTRRTVGMEVAKRRVSRLATFVSVALILLLAMQGFAAAKDGKKKRPKKSVTTTTTIATVPPGVNFSLASDAGYSFAVNGLSIDSLWQDVATAPPGMKWVSLGTGKASVTNTTSGRITEPPILEIVVAIPAGCDPNTRTVTNGAPCKAGGFYLIGSKVALRPTQNGAEMPAGATWTYSVTRSNADLGKALIPESVRVDGYYWRLDRWSQFTTPAGNRTVSPGGAWNAVNVPASGAPIG